MYGVDITFKLSGEEPSVYHYAEYPSRLDASTAARSVASTLIMGAGGKPEESAAKCLELDKLGSVEISGKGGALRLEIVEA